MIREPKTKTGIKGFDPLVDGGLTQGHVVLLSGTPATGKTIFGLEFIYNGARTYEEKGLYITFEEKEKALLSQAAKFRWDLDHLRKKKMLQILSIAPSEITHTTVDHIADLVKKNKIRRVVVDSLSTLAINTPTITPDTNTVNDLAVQRFIYSFVDGIKKLEGTTTILISQTPDDKTLSRDTVSEFVCDSIINLMYESMGGDFSRSLTVRKMRGAKNDDDVHPLEIGDKGLSVHTL